MIFLVQQRKQIHWNLQHDSSHYILYSTLRISEAYYADVTFGSGKEYTRVWQEFNLVFCPPYLHCTSPRITWIPETEETISRRNKWHLVVRYRQCVFVFSLTRRYKAVIVFTCLHFTTTNKTGASSRCLVIQC
jgi:hypothetical protein